MSLPVVLAMIAIVVGLVAIGYGLCMDEGLPETEKYGRIAVLGSALVCTGALTLLYELAAWTLWALQGRT